MPEQTYLACEECHDRVHETEIGRFQGRLLCFDCETREKQALIKKLREGNPLPAKPDQKTQVVVCTEADLTAGAKIVIRDEHGEIDYLATALGERIEARGQSEAQHFDKLSAAPTQPPTLRCQSCDKPARPNEVRCWFCATSLPIKEEPQIVTTVAASVLPYRPTVQNPGGPCTGCVNFFPIGALEVVDGKLYCPKCLDEKREEEDPHPILCFEPDLDAAVAAGIELSTKGFALLADGFWSLTPAHAERLRAQWIHTHALLVATRVSGLWSDFSKLDASLLELKRLLPGGTE